MIDLPDDNHVGHCAESPGLGISGRVGEKPSKAMNEQITPGDTQGKVSRPAQDNPAVIDASKWRFTPGAGNDSTL
jgi:hypothetical protein